MHLAPSPLHGKAPVCATRAHPRQQQPPSCPWDLCHPRTLTLNHNRPWTPARCSKLKHATLPHAHPTLRRIPPHARVPVEARAPVVPTHPNAQPQLPMDASLSAMQQAQACHAAPCTPYAQVQSRRILSHAHVPVEARAPVVPMHPNAYHPIRVSPWRPGAGGTHAPRRIPSQAHVPVEARAPVVPTHPDAQPQPPMGAGAMQQAQACRAAPRTPYAQVQSRRISPHGPTRISPWRPGRRWCPCAFCYPARALQSS
jgi:hypothetical protein